MNAYNRPNEFLGMFESRCDEGYGGSYCSPTTPLPTHLKNHFDLPNNNKNNNKNNNLNMIDKSNNINNNIINNNNVDTGTMDNKNIYKNNMKYINNKNDEIYNHNNNNNKNNNKQKRNRRNIRTENNKNKNKIIKGVDNSYVKVHGGSVGRFCGVVASDNALVFHQVLFSFS